MCKTWTAKKHICAECLSKRETKSQGVTTYTGILSGNHDCRSIVTSRATLLQQECYFGASAPVCSQGPGEDTQAAETQAKNTQQCQILNPSAMLCNSPNHSRIPYKTLSSDKKKSRSRVKNIDQKNMTFKPQSARLIHNSSV